MLRVLLVDDEPFIIQGLKLLIDWEREGYEIVETAANGQEAYDYLKEHAVDLIVADIRMPQMTGLELLEHIRREHISDAYFVILSGYADFYYAQEALRNQCTDYILKPVENDKLVGILKKVAELNQDREEKRDADQIHEQAYLARNVIAAISGKFDEQNISYLKEHMHLDASMKYIDIQLDDALLGEEISDDEKRSCQRKVYEACRTYLKEDEDHVVFDVSNEEKIYDVGIVYCNYMAENAGVSEAAYLESLLAYIRGGISLPILMLVGKEISDIDSLSKSYGTVCMLRSVLGFRSRKDIYYYESEVQVSNSGLVICKDSIDVLLRAVEENNEIHIREGVKNFYDQMQSTGVGKETMTLNINYFLFQLIHLATEQDGDVNQEEILHTISEGAFTDGIKRGSSTHMVRFACEYGNYLTQLRKNVSRGVIGDIEREIHENYAGNLTLKGLSEKYYVNSAYLGQVFRKKYGLSFKDYLNRYRIDQACQLLLRTDDKIYQIAETVGYHDLDYFVNRFIAIKGCTPAKYRKKSMEDPSGT